MYEFRDDVPAIDLLTGIPAVRLAIDAGAGLDGVLAAAYLGRDVYDRERPGALLYE
jgi:hypothetical protein